MRNINTAPGLQRGGITFEYAVTPVPARGIEPLMSVSKTDALPLGYAVKMMSDRVVYGANLENWCVKHA